MSPIKHDDNAAKKWMIGILVVVIPLLLGAGIAWGVASNTISSNEEDLNKAKEDIILLQTEQAGVKTLIGATREDVKELKQDMKNGFDDIKQLIKDFR